MELNLILRPEERELGELILTFFTFRSTVGWSLIFIIAFKDVSFATLILFYKERVKILYSHAILNFD